MSGMGCFHRMLIKLINFVISSMTVYNRCILISPMEGSA